MKIQSPKYTSITLSFASCKVTFDKEGVAEIEDENWEEIKDMPLIYEFGKLPKVNVSSKTKAEDSTTIAALRDEVARYKDIAETRLRKISEKEEAEKVLREECGRLQKENEALKTNVSVEKVSESDSLREKLQPMQFNALKKTLKESGLDASKVDSFKSKDELIDFAVNEVN